MSVMIVVLAAAGILAAGMAVYFTTPIMYALKTNAALWAPCATEPACIAIRDQVYEFYGPLALLLMGAVVIYSYANAGKRQVNEF